MSAKPKYLKINIDSAAKSLAGYKVLGDVYEGSQRVLVLERPETVVVRRQRRAKATPVVAEAEAQ